MYGTLVDPIAISEQLKGYLAEEAPRVALVWRQKAARVHVPPYSIPALTKSCSVPLAFEGAWSNGPDP
jgi:hypothetical protein